MTADAWCDGEPAAATLRHGPWSLVRRADSFDDISFAGRKVLRSIRFVVRDHDRRTVPLWITAVTISADAAALRVTLSGETDDPDVGMNWTRRLVLAEDRLHVDIDGDVRERFRRNRIGLVVLHPPTLAGVDVTVRTPSDSAVERVFSEGISSHEPAQDIAGLDWTADGVDCRLELAGDVFEMEDQRNWTDASYKTYSTPLSRPFPVTCEPGERIRQSVTPRCVVVDPRRTPARGRSTPGLLEIGGVALTFSLTPQMHDRSRRQAIESIPIQRLLADQAALWSGGNGVHIGRVTLRPRFNAVATSVRADGTGPSQEAESTDPRQGSPAAAVWPIASATALAVPGVRSVTYWELSGPRGLSPSTAACATLRPRPSDGSARCRARPSCTPGSPWAGRRCWSRRRLAR